MPFKTAKGATTTMDDEVAELAEIKNGQQTQVTYVVRSEVNWARQVTLISGSETTPGAGENTG